MLRRVSFEIHSISFLDRTWSLSGASWCIYFLFRWLAATSHWRRPVGARALHFSPPHEVQVMTFVKSCHEFGSRVCLFGTSKMTGFRISGKYPWLSLSQRLQDQIWQDSMVPTVSILKKWLVPFGNDNAVRWESSIFVRFCHYCFDYIYSFLLWKLNTRHFALFCFMSEEQQARASPLMFVSRILLKKNTW